MTSCQRHRVSSRQTNSRVQLFLGYDTLSDTGSAQDKQTQGFSYFLAMTPCQRHRVSSRQTNSRVQLFLGYDILSDTGSAQDKQTQGFSYFLALTSCQRHRVSSRQTQGFSYFLAMTSCQRHRVSSRQTKLFYIRLQKMTSRQKPRQSMCPCVCLHTCLVYQFLRQFVQNKTKT